MNKPVLLTVLALASVGIPHAQQHTVVAIELWARSSERPHLGLRSLRSWSYYDDEDSVIVRVALNEASSDTAAVVLVAVEFGEVPVIRDPLDPGAVALDSSLALPVAWVSSGVVLRRPLVEARTTSRQVAIDVGSFTVVRRYHARVQRGPEMMLAKLRLRAAVVVRRNGIQVPVSAAARVYGVTEGY